MDVKKEDGFSALHLAALNNHRDVAEILIKEVGGGSVNGPVFVCAWCRLAAMLPLVCPRAAVATYVAFHHQCE